MYVPKHKRKFGCTWRPQEGSRGGNHGSFGISILENGGMADELVLSLGEARRLAIRSQHLAGPEPARGIDGMRRVLRGLRVLQIDPVNVVARSHLLVLSGERLIGRVVPRVDRRRGELVVEGVFAEEEFSGAGAVADRSVAAAIESLASFAGAASVSYSGPVSFGVS